MKAECARCGKREQTDRMILSAFSRQRYCRDFDACDRRKARRERKAAA